MTLLPTPWFRTAVLAAVAVATLAVAPADARPRYRCNPPGHAGGARATRLYRGYRTNPPGPAGGRGTNWANPPGPVGGPGASPYRLRPYRRR